jgi:hypothetical protein
MSGIAYDPARKKAPDFAKGDGLLSTLLGGSIFCPSVATLFEGRMTLLPFVPSIGVRPDAESSVMKYSWAASVTQEVEAIRMNLSVCCSGNAIYGNNAVANACLAIS